MGRPKHYQFDLDHPIHGTIRLQVIDVMEALFPTDIHLSQSFKYMARAGRKDESSYHQDLGKAAYWILRCLKQSGGTKELMELQDEFFIDPL